MPSEISRTVIDSMVALSADVIKLCRKLDLPPPVLSQITRSVCSIGANFAEAQDASSKKDFINKIFIAKKEAGETKYWLAIVASLTEATDETAALAQRVQHVTMMLQKIISTSKRPHS